MLNKRQSRLNMPPGGMPGQFPPQMPQGPGFGPGQAFPDFSQSAFYRVYRERREFVKPLPRW